eukprot:s575_g18.t1
MHLVTQEAAVGQISNMMTIVVEIHKQVQLLQNELAAYCSTQDAAGPQLQLRGTSGDSFASVDLASRFQAGAKEDTFVVNSRQVDSEVVRNQRAEAAAASSNMSQMVRRNTRTALQEQSEGRGSFLSSSEMRNGFQRISTSLRMSRMGTMKRNQMIEEVTEAAPKEGLQGASLEQRLQTFGMQMVEMAGDGNCQFRTIAFNLFRNQARAWSWRAFAYGIACGSGSVLVILLIWLLSL